METKNFDVLRSLLKPVTKEQMEAIVRARIGASTAGEQLTLADAGLEDEVRKLLEPKRST